MDGWVIQLAPNTGSTTLGSRAIPGQSNIDRRCGLLPDVYPRTDICVSTGNSTLYSMYYLTGTGYTDPSWEWMPADFRSGVPALAKVWPRRWRSNRCSTHGNVGLLSVQQLRDEQDNAQAAVIDLESVHFMDQ